MKSDGRNNGIKMVGLMGSQHYGTKRIKLAIDLHGRISG